MRAWPREPLRVAVCLALILLAVALPGTLPGMAAQEAPESPGSSTSTLRGRLQDGEGNPIAGWTIALHRVDGAGGVELGTAVTDSAGRFSFEGEFVDEGVYFVATRYEGSLYVGAPFRAPGPPDAEYVVVVGTEVGLVPSLGDAPPLPPPPDGVPWVAVAFAAITVATFIAVQRAGARNRTWRALAVELAELEEGQGARGREGGAPVHDQLAKRRAELWERLRAATGIS